MGPALSRLANAKQPVQKPNEEDFGFKELFSGTNPAVDIIAIHGLGGHRESTWKADDGTLWLRDFLGDDLPNVRVLSYGYDAAPGSDRRVAHNTIRELADQFVNALVKERTDHPRRPIIFIAHDLGGIILKWALVICQTQTMASDWKLRNILVSTNGILFFGTPHSGVANEIIDGIKRVASGYREATTVILNDLRANSFELETVQKLYGQATSEKIKTIFFYSVYQEKGSGKMFVDYHAARVPGDRDAVTEGLYAYHRDMVRFGIRNNNYTSVRYYIKENVDSASEKVGAKWVTEDTLRSAVTGVLVSEYTPREGIPSTLGPVPADRPQLRESSDSVRGSPQSAPPNMTSPSESSKAPDRRVTTKVNDFGIKELASGTNPIFDIVAIHGLDGHREKTWMTKNGELWLRDLLPHDFSNARILSYGYDADTGSKERVSTQNMRRHAEGFAQALAMHRKNQPERPIIFIAHDLGGIILKWALVMCHSQSLDSKCDLRSILASTHAILFFGTPHSGLDNNILDDIRHMASKCAHKTDVLLKDLKENSKQLENVQRLYLGISEINTIFFTEVYGGKNGRLTVQPHSATVKGDRKAIEIGLHADHHDMVRFANREDVNYKTVVQHILEYAENAYEQVWKRWATEASIRRIVTGRGPPKRAFETGVGTTSGREMVLYRPLPAPTALLAIEAPPRAPTAQEELFGGKKPIKQLVREKI